MARFLPLWAIWIVLFNFYLIAEISISKFLFVVTSKSLDYFLVSSLSLRSFFYLNFWKITENNFSGLDKVSVVSFSFGSLCAFSNNWANCDDLRINH